MRQTQQELLNCMDLMGAAHVPSTAWCGDIATSFESYADRREPEATWEVDEGRRTML